MVQQNCLACQNPIEGQPGTRVICPRCGRNNVMALAAPPGAGVFTPAPVPQPVAPPAPTGPLKTHPPAIVALVCGILSLTLGWIQGPFMGPFGEDMFGVFGIISFVAAILAVVLGVVSIKEINRRPQELKGKGLAIAGMVLGIIFIGLVALAFLLVLLFFAMCAAACGGAGSQLIPAGLVGLSAPRTWASSLRSGFAQLRRDPWRVLLTHHPRCGAFAADTIGTRSGPVCASCAALGAGAVLGLAALRLLPPLAAEASVITGATIALALHAASALGATPYRSLKLTAKTLTGAALALMAEGLMGAPVEAALITLVFALGGIPLVLVRRSLMARRWSLHVHDAGCATA